MRLRKWSVNDWIDPLSSIWTDYTREDDIISFHNDIIDVSNKLDFYDDKYSRNNDIYYDTIIYDYHYIKNKWILKKTLYYDKNILSYNLIQYEPKIMKYRCNFNELHFINEISYYNNPRITEFVFPELKIDNLFI